MILFMVSISAVYQALFEVPISNGTGHITMVQARPKIETALSTMKEYI
jgi:hypothetical protein